MFTSSDDCLAQAPPKVQSLVEAFCGLRNPLSNLYMCLEGCKWDMAENIEVSLSEHEYQYKKLSEHGKVDKANQLLEEIPIDVMKWAEFYVPQDQESSI